MTENTAEGQNTPHAVVTTATDSGPYSLIVTTAISAVSEVRFYEETVDHIVEEHPEFAGELPSVIGSIGQTVSKPSAVYHSRTAPGKGYVYESNGNTLAGAPMYVAVRVVQGTSARVATAYYSSESYKGDLAWKDGEK